MKKRIFFYVGLTSLFFTGIQWFSAYRSSKENSIHTNSIIQNVEAIGSGTEGASKATLPLIKISSSEDKGDVWGVDLNDYLITTNVSIGTEFLHLRDQAYVLSEKISLDNLSISLFKASSLPVLSSNMHLPLSVQDVPMSVHAVSFNNLQKPEVSKVMLFKGLVAPEKESDALPTNGALLFYSQANKWFLLGSYDAQYQKMKELDLALPKVIFTSNSSTGGFHGNVEKFFVLENSYLQLVFSNKGAAVEGINLSLNKERDGVKIVKEIEADRKLKASYPQMSMFPGVSFVLPDGKIDHGKGILGNYYPLLRRTDLINNKENKPTFYAFNIVSDNENDVEVFYNVVDFSDDHILFEGYQHGRLIRKEFRLSATDPYCIDCSISVDNGSGLWITSGIPEVELMSNAHLPFVKCATTKKQSIEVEKVRLPKANNRISVGSLHPNWLVTSNGYFGIIMQPLHGRSHGYRVKARSAVNAPSRLSLLNTKLRRNPASKYNGYEVLLPLSSSKAKATAFRIYAGPFDKQILKALDEKIQDETGVNPNFLRSLDTKGIFSFISLPFSKFLFLVMQLFQYMTGSWGISIILLTVFLRLVLYPLNSWSLKSMKRMQLLSPKIQSIQKKYKGEQRKAQAEIIALYKKYNVNPFMGFIPILIQIPFLLAMFDLLKTSFPLRGTQFIPGWINNLTAPDVILQWSESLPLLGTELHLLPLLLGVVMFMQQKISSKKVVVEEMSDQQRQQKAMGTLMTAFFVIMFYNAPSGLNLYWLCSMLLGIFQQWLTNRTVDGSCSGILETADSKIISGKK